MTINERIDEIIKDLFNGKKSHFASKIGVSATVIENIVGTRKGNPSFGVLEKIVFAIENLNSNWLITGRGKMLLTQTNDKNIFNKESEFELLKQLVESQKETITLQRNKIAELEEKLKSNL